MSEPLMQSIDRDRQREAIARQIFEDDLRQFVSSWAPERMYERDQFQRDLTLLLRDAMQSQAETFSAGVDRYASTMLRNQSLAPLNVIFEKPKEPKP